MLSDLSFTEPFSPRGSRGSPEGSRRAGRAGGATAREIAVVLVVAALGGARGARSIYQKVDCTPNDPIYTQQTHGGREKPLPPFFLFEKLFIYKIGKQCIKNYDVFLKCQEYLNLAICFFSIIFISSMRYSSEELLI